MSNSIAPLSRKGQLISIGRRCKKCYNIKKIYQLYILIAPALLYFIIFRYIPIYGSQIAFRDYLPSKGFMGSAFVGFEHFTRFFGSPDAFKVVFNTIYLSIMNISANFPLPIILALILNQIKGIRFKKVFQTITYAPYFVSLVVLVGMLNIFLSPRTGIVNHLIIALGGKEIFFMAQPEYFRPVYILSEMWQHTGFWMVIYIAALASVNPELYESAIVDGADKLQRLWYIDIPSILPTIIIMLILTVGKILSVGFEKVYLFQNILNIGVSELIETFVYKQGILSGQLSYASAVGLFQSLTNLVILLVVNSLAKRYSETSIF